MNTHPSTVHSDIRPIDFTLAVVGGSAGSAILSAMQPNSWISVIFALVVMGTISFLRWRLASKTKDGPSLEAYAEDLYLLGYLLTLAALLGMAPRLMTDDTNLFHIAGIKLFTTIAGLGVMLIFRQIARRWIAESDAGTSNQFVQQQEIFSSAVAKLNRSAEDLTAKMEEVARRFDPDLLGPVAEWSNRAANALSGATKAFESIPSATVPGLNSLRELAGDFSRVKIAITELTNTLTVQLGNATKTLGRDLDDVGKVARNLSASVADLAPATESSRASLEKLGAQALQEVGSLVSVNQALVQISSELNKVEIAMRQLSPSGAPDVGVPINRLVQAILMASDKADQSLNQMDGLQSNLRLVSAASQTLGERLECSVSMPLKAHEIAINRTYQQFQDILRELGNITEKFNAFQIQESSKLISIAENIKFLRLASDASYQKTHNVSDGFRDSIADSSETEGPREKPKIAPETDNT